MFVNLVTGATLPDRGEVRVFGRPTSAITDSADWLAVVDRFGIVSERAVLLDSLTVVQNLAMPFTLEIEPPPDDMRRRAVALADEVGLAAASLDRPVAELDAGRTACASGSGARWRSIPAVVLLEHPTAEIPPDAVAELAAAVPDDLARRTIAPDGGRGVCRGRVATRCLTLDPATGRLAQRTGWLSRLCGDDVRMDVLRESAMRTRMSAKERLCEQLATVLLSVLCRRCAAQRRKAKPRVFFVEPKNNATVTSPAHLKFGVENYKIAAVPTGPSKTARPGVGHYHVGIDVPCVADGQDDRERARRRGCISAKAIPKSTCS